MPESLHDFCRSLLLALGFLSLAIAAFFMIRQYDFKRMLAYSSVEHIGLLAILLSCGMKDLTAQAAVQWHLVGHSLLKMVLFLVAGNIFLAYGTRSVSAIKGMFSSMPRTAFLFIAGVLLLCGTPPSPLFVTELLLNLPAWTLARRRSLAVAVPGLRRDAVHGPENVHGYQPPFCG